MIQEKVSRGYVTGIVFMVALFYGLATMLQAQEKEKDTGPERGMAIYTEYSGITVPPGESVRMELTVDNKGRKDENVFLTLTTIAKGWKASLKGPTYTVSSITVPGRKTRTLTFNADPDKGVKPGTFNFQIDARTEDGQFTSTQKIEVTVREKTTASDDFTVTASYPILKGQPDSKFEFSIDINNKSDADRNFNLSAQGPEKWDIIFKPSYEQKQISTIRIKATQQQSINVEATPPKGVAAGEYPILVSIGPDERKAQVKLAVVLSGTYQLDAGTPTGLLSLDAVPGKASNLSLYVKNTGTAVNRNISFNSFKPENWKVEFKPEKIDAVEPGALKQVEVTITPAGQALVGDYSVSVSVDGEKGSSKNVELRVGVKTSPAWGWIGLIIIVLVVGGMSILFLRLGRR